ncbi:MAG TPA: OB-fold domain-containing protein [Novosphingobium sp.]|nr:OB-fold domain-containing protein [Novosphingobium sp.]
MSGDGMSEVGPAQVWQAALAEGRLLLQRPVGGGKALFPPRDAAPGSGAALEWFAASGRAVLYSLTWVQQRPPAAAYAIALVELAEGPRLMARLDGLDGAGAHIGMALAARITPGADGPALTFIPAGEA